MNEPLDERSVSWTTWSSAGYSVRNSKLHILKLHDDTSTDTSTLCGRSIPEEGNGIEFDEFDEGKCKKCHAIYSRQ